MKYIWLLASFFIVTQGAEVCYPKLGCFNDEPPYYYFPLPSRPEEINAEFRLYTRANPGDKDYRVITADNPGELFNASRPTLVYVHGFMASADMPHVLEMKKTFLQYKDYNLIVVQWTEGATNIIYPQSASDTRVLGAQIALLLKNYQGLAGLSLKDVHCVGLSLGAQTCGQMGKRLKVFGLSVARISGLDPAGPTFDTAGTKGRLYKGDADFIDVIHSNSADHYFLMGIGKISGDVDFYPNGGGVQPGCENPEFPLKRMSGKGIPERYFDFANCYHAKSEEYFQYSMTTECRFTASPCRSKKEINEGLCDKCDPNSTCQYMGINAIRHRNRTGTFYLKTVKDVPHCMD